MIKSTFVYKNFLPLLFTAVLVLFGQRVFIKAIVSFSRGIELDTLGFWEFIMSIVLGAISIFILGTYLYVVAWIINNYTNFKSGVWIVSLSLAIGVVIQFVFSMFSPVYRYESLFLSFFTIVFFVFNEGLNWKSKRQWPF